MINVQELTNIQVADVFMNDYPDFVDAYIDSAEWKSGQKVTDLELDEINDYHSEFVQDCAYKQKFL